MFLFVTMINFHAPKRPRVTGLSCCGSWMFIRIQKTSRIRNQQQQQKRRWKNLVFFCSHKLHKIENYLILKQVKTIFLPIHSKNYSSTFYLKKLSLSSQKYGFRIRDPEKPIPDPRSRDQRGTESGFRNTGEHELLERKKKGIFSHFLLRGLTACPGSGNRTFGTVRYYIVH